ncbi:MAG: hypothetical protein WKG03_08115 [Telluria sp.]
MTSESKPPAASAELMAKVFRGRLHVRFEKMQEVLALCRANPADDANWRELQRLLQVLAEAAGVFGCDTLGEQAGLIELLLADMLAERARSQSDIDDIARLLALLQDRV